jgi:hypothetical protein
MFDTCDFLMGDNDSIVIAIPGQVPKGENLTLILYRNGLMFRHGDTTIGDVSCGHREVFKRLSKRDKVGLIEVTEDPGFPIYIAAVADIQLHRAV